MHICDCGKQYPYRASLHNHKKKCSFIKQENSEYTQSFNNNISTDEIIDDDPSKEIVLKLVENAEIKNLLFKQFETMHAQMCEQQKQMNEQINELIPRVGNNNILIRIN